MKKILLASFGALLLLVTSCDVLLHTANTVLTEGVGDGTLPLTNEEVISGLKEALIVGTNNSSSLTSKENGFFENARIKLPFPEDALKVKEQAEKLGLGGQVDKFVLTLNRAAEEATKEAAPIFVNAIKEMSLTDGFNILKGADNAATQFLKDNTTSQLSNAFSPKVKTAIDKVELTKFWTPLMSAYNTATLLTGTKKVNPDLEAYVTEKAIAGLFTLIEDEEKKIRKDPIARVSDILKRVFGSIDQ